MKFVNYFMHICTKYSEICCLTDGTTCFSYQYKNKFHLIWK